MNKSPVCNNLPGFIYINVMKKYFIFLFFILYCNFSKGQKLQFVPRAGFQYHGLSYISKGDPHPSDFKKTVPEFEATIAADVKYKTKHLTHVVSIQSVALGPSFAFSNIYLDKGIVPTFRGHHSASSIDQPILSYGIEKESKGNSRLRFNYSVQAGIGFNKSREAYDSILPPDSYGREDSVGYYYYAIQYKRSGIGIFLTGKAGVSFYNKRNKSFLNLQVFWHQGLKKMAEYAILYEYGYFNYPQYQRSQQVKLKTRGTVFGVMVGVPIRILK